MTEHPTLRLIYKSLALLLLAYAIVYGLLRPLPDIGGNIEQTSRNLFFHVPMWFCMGLMAALSLVWSLQYLRKDSGQSLAASTADLDRRASEAAKLAAFFGCLGLLTGMIWARGTWGELLPATDPTAYWSWDPKQTGALIAVLAYGAYFLLRNSIESPRMRARVAAVYNLFAAAALFPLTVLVPRALGGLHPGADGSPVFNSADISNDYRIIFYPAIVGWLLLACWLLELRVRMERVKEVIQ